MCQGALDSFLPNVNVRVKDEQTANPKITLSVDDPSDPSTILVTEMMLLCGEVIAEFGCRKGIRLPYRGQGANEDAKEGLQLIPEGPARAMASIRCMLPAEMSFQKSLEHAVLGLPGYVQFTSPLRRYSDLLAHYQVSTNISNGSAMVWRWYSLLFLTTC
jgi:exoribonuclease R